MKRLLHLSLDTETLTSPTITCRKFPYLGMHFIDISGYLKDELAAGTTLVLTTLPSANKPSASHALAAYFTAGTVSVMARISGTGNVEIRTDGTKSSGQYINVSGWWIK